MNISKAPLLGPNSVFSNLRKCFLALAMLALVGLVPNSNQAFAQTGQAEIEFWQSVKSAKDPLELEAYLAAYPQGKFAPLARLRIRKLTSQAPQPQAPQPQVPQAQVPQPQVPQPPVPQVQVPQPPVPQVQVPQPPVPQVPLQPVPQPQVPQAPQGYTPPPAPRLPAFVPENTNVTDASCQAKLGPQGFAAPNFTGTGSVCLCRTPFALSNDGMACNYNAAADVPRQPTLPPVASPAPPPRPQIQPRPRPAPGIRKPVRQPPRITRKPPRVKKRPSRASGRSLANNYCRRKYGARLKNVVVKKSKFYCHYQLTLGNNSSIGVKKKKFKNLKR